MNAGQGQKPLIVLDRDGVINEDSDAYVKSAEEWIPIPGSIEAIGRLTRTGYPVAVATNQSGIGRGYYNEAALEAMHAKMLDLVAKAGGRIDAIVFCPHHPDTRCDCRKPLPGLLHQIQEQLGLSLEGAYMIGDSIRDLEAGVAAGCRPVLVRTGKGEKSVLALPQSGLGDVPIYDDLAAFVDRLISG